MPPSVSPTKSGVPVPILQVCKHRVSAVVTQEELERHGVSREKLVERIADIVSRNLASGRARRAMAVSRGAEGQGGRGVEEQGRTHLCPSAPLPLGTEVGGPLEAYIDRVIAAYLREHRRVERLAARDEATWTELYERLASQAYYMLLRWQVPAARAADEAHDLAQQICEVIFSHPFPYDVPFDAWSTRILTNRILYRHTRSQDLMDREPGILSLDRPGRDATDDDFSLYDLLADESGESAFESVEVQERLIQAIAGLRSTAQQQVIIYTYFYELSDDEIARDLDKSKQAIYNLRYRALRRLKQILKKVKE